MHDASLNDLNKSTGTVSWDSGQELNGSPVDVAFDSYFLDLILIGVLLVLLYPMFRLARVPFRIDLEGMATAYWGGTAIHAAFVAILLAVLTLPLRDTLVPFIERYQKQKARILISLVLAGVMIYCFGIFLGLAITIDGLALTELMERKKASFESTLVDIFIPALYLFSGIVLIFSFNHVIAWSKFAGTDDVVFQRLDRVLLHASVSNISHWSLEHLPRWFFRILEFAYYSLFRQIGATIVLAALLGSRRYAMRYVGTLLFAYSIALLTFFVWPSIGPFSICPVHTSSYPHWLATYVTQATILAKARLLVAHQLSPFVASVNLADYYIGFPCMHVALPSIAIWFLRPWKKIALCLVVFDAILLVPSIIFLEWHYLVDIAAGFGVAFMAIWLYQRLAEMAQFLPFPYRNASPTLAVAK